MTRDTSTPVISVAHLRAVLADSKIEHEVIRRLQSGSVVESPLGSTAKHRADALHLSSCYDGDARSPLGNEVKLCRSYCACCSGHGAIWAG